MFGYGGHGGLGACCDFGYGGKDRCDDFILIVVLFILLIIVGAVICF
jgi:uncharacterized protein (TIGR01732 family)